MFFMHKSKKAVISLVVAAALTGCFGQKSEEEYLALAKTSIENGEINTAVINLKNVLTANSKSMEGRFLLGLTYLNTGLWVSAEKELELALEYGYDKSIVIPALAKAYYHLGDVKGVEELVAHLDELTEESQTALKTFIAITLLKEEYFDQGLNYLHEVVETNYKSKYTKLSQAWQLGINKDLPQALTVIDETLNDFPDFMEAIEYKAYLLFKLQDMTEAAEYFGQYIKAHPQAHELRMMYALALVYSEDYLQAEKHVDLLLTGMPDSAKLNEIKAQTRFAASDFKKAKQFAETASRKNRNLVLAKIIAGISSYQLKQFEAAYSHLNGVKDKLSYQHPARKLLNALRLQMGYENDVYKELLTSQNDSLDVNTLSISATELFKLGKVDEANALLEIASEKSESNARVLYQQGIFKLYNDDPSAIEFFEKAVERNPELESAMTLMLLESLKQQDYDKAFSVADKIADKNPELSLTYKGVIYTRKGELEKAKIAFNEALSINGINAGVSYKLAQVYEIEKNNELAFTHYKKSLDANMNYPLAASALLKLSLKEDFKEQVEGYLQTLVENNGLKPRTHTYLAAYHILHNNFNDAISVLDNGLSFIPSDYNLLMLKGKVQANTKKFDEALLTFDEILEVSPENGLANIAKARILALTGRIDDAIKVQKTAINLLPFSTEAALGLTSLYLKKGDVNAASNVLDNIRSSSKSALDINHFKGKVAFYKKDFNKAAMILKKVFLKRQSEEVTIQLATSLSETNRIQEAVNVLELYHSEVRSGGTLNSLLKYAEILEKIDLNKALQVYSDILNKSNRHFAMLNNIAMVYLNLGRFEESVKYAEEAYKKAETNNAVQNTYGLTLLAVGNNVEAEKYLKQAFLGNQNNENYKVHYAQSLLSNSKTEKSKALFIAVNKGELNPYSLIIYNKLSTALN